MMKPVRFALLLVALLLTLSVVGGILAQEPVVLTTGRQMGSSDIPTLDPGLAEDVPSVQVISELFPELVRINEETALPEDGMGTFTVSDDNLVYTFSITPEVPWVRYNADSGAVEAVTDESGSVRYVTAADFAYGMLRTLDPNTAGPYQYVLLPWIAGGTEFGSADPATADMEALRAGVALNVVDDYTLEITVAQASAVTPMIFGLWITAAQPSWVIDEFADFWIDPENIVTYGPWALKDWQRGDGGSLTMIKNSLFPGSNAIPAAQIDEVVFRFLDESAQLTEFEAGTLDVAEAPDDQIERITSNPDLSAGYFTGPGTCTYYYGFNVEQPPFDDVRARRAFSMAIDRESLTTNVVTAGQTPAGLFALPSLNAAPTTELYPDIGIHSDAEAALALWNEYLADTGTDPATVQITLFHNESSLHGSIAQAIQQMWADTLGVTVQIATADFATYLDTRGDYNVYRAGWCFDYPDSHNYYYDASWHSDLLAENDTHWSNAEYDSLIDQAFVAPTVEERRDLYAQADDILVNTEAAIAPIYFYVTNDLTAPGITRTHSLITREYYEKWTVGQ